MKLSRILKTARAVSDPFKVTDGDKFDLDDHDPGNTLEFTHEDKPRAKEALATGVEALALLQDILYAQDRWGVLVIFQAMDAAGKDGAIKHVMSGVNPQGCQVFSFKSPSAEELDHDFMWRCMKCMPERGRIGIFNRSYYEEVLVVRVHEELMKKQKLPRSLMNGKVFKERYEDIAAIERYLARNGIAVCKFFLNVSRKEQGKRFMERLDNPDKNWKFSASDAREREYWDDYMKAYETMIRRTAAPHAPWYVVPADNKWFTRVVVAAAIIDLLGGLGLAYPKVDEEKRKELESARQILAAN
jgi:PPK2 family polyphosphate:nucleotide phosphotransferase